MGEWRELALEDIAAKSRNALVGGPFGSNLVSTDYVYFGTPVIRGQNMRERFVGGEFAYVTSEKANELSSNLAHPDDLIFTQRGTLGQVAIVPGRDFDCYLISQSQMKLTADPAVADSMYLYYVFRSDEQVRYFRQHAIQTGVPHINLSILRSTRILLPDLVVQNAIARTLGTLDDKIELNRRMNETLEAAARTLFKSWFVDFDPTFRASKGRNLGLPKQIAGLFSDSFVGSDLGDIPKTWTVDTLGSVAQQMRRSIQPFEVPPGTPYIGLEHMPRRSIALAEWAIADSLESGKSEFKAGEILFGKLRPYFHKVGVAPIGGVCSTDIVVIAPMDPAWFGFVLGHTSSERFVEYANSGSTGTKMPRTSWHEMERYPVVIPPKQLAEAFTAIVEPFVQKIRVTILESRTLAALRDTLLPKLISGQIRIKDAERFVAGA